MFYIDFNNIKKSIILPQLGIGAQVKSLSHQTKRLLHN